jgi:hypothetical protein
MEKFRKKQWEADGIRQASQQPSPTACRTTGKKKIPTSWPLSPSLLYFAAVYEFRINSDTASLQSVGYKRIEILLEGAQPIAKHLHEVTQPRKVQKYVILKRDLKSRY